TLAAGTDDAQTYTFGYNTSGQLESITYPDGSETVYRYVLGNVTRITRNAPETEESLETRYTYDGAGNLDAILLPGADEDINVTYDALDRRVRYVNGADDSWAYTYDAASNLAQISDPLGSVVTYIYDDYDRVTQIAYPSGSVVDLNYDTRGNLRTVVLPVNSAGTAQIITYRLNANQQIEEMQIGNNVTAFSYDGMGNVIQRVSPDGTTTDYQYDSANRLVAMLYDNQAPVLFSYDADGNLVRANDITFAYDVLGRRIQSTANLAIAYTYDNSNNLLTRTTDTLGTTTYSYDAFNRVTSVALDDVSATISYDSEGQIASIQRSNNVRTNFTYDEVGRPFTIGHSSDAVARLDTLSYFYDPAGNVTRVNRLNNDGSSQISYSYDVDQRLISERWLNDEGETIYTISYAYDNAGNRISENRNGRITNYTYDNQNRLTAETRNASGQGRQFILVPIFGLGLGALIVRRRRKWWLVIPVATLFVGSVFAQTNADEIRVSYEYNVFSSVETVTYRSDDDVDVLAYAYDAENRLVNVSGTNREGDAVNTTITYDPFSRIVSISTLDADYTLYWDNHTLIGMDDGSGVDRFLWLNDTQLATLTAEGETLWHLNDRQGTTRRFVDSTGALVDDPANFLEFGSFGVRIYPYSEDRVAPNGATITVPTLFANGQLYEPSIDMYLLGVRAYDPTIGRFIQLDPVRQDPFGTLYTYTRNRPLVFADPTGMVVETFNAPVSSATAPDAIAPSDLLPAFDMPIDTMPSVHRQQANEVFRMLELLMATRYGVNGSVLQLSSFNDALYLQNLNPVPESVQMASAEPLMNLMAYYSQDDGWQTDPRPSSNDAYDAFAFLRDMEGMLAQAYVRPAIFCCDTPMAQDFAFVPQVTLPQGRSADSLQTSMFVDLLQPISTLPSLEPDVENLDSLLPLAIAPVVSLPEVNLPSAPVEPQILDSLDALRQQTFEFNSRIWSLDGQDCDACLPPLGFSQ
ncbi:MAG: RHS repeat-associated core domain-containing protein, partial [Chloroflexota bacterium]